MKEKLPFIIYIGIGAVLMAASLPHMDGYYGNMVFWVGVRHGLRRERAAAQILLVAGPRTQRRLRSQRQEAHINAVDERKQMLADAGGLPGQPAHVLDPAWGWILCWRC